MRPPPVSPLHERIATTAPVISVRKPQEYLRHHMRPRLVRASNEGRLAIGIEHIARHVRITPSQSERDAFDLVGGRRNFRRNLELADLRTADGGWLFFAAILRPTEAGLEVLGYNFERFFQTDSRPSWVRFDFNEPGHANDDRGLRSHCHPGNDDIQLPSPIFAPHELVDVLLGGLGPRDGRKPRTKG